MLKFYLLKDECLFLTVTNFRLNVLSDKKFHLEGHNQVDGWLFETGKKEKISMTKFLKFFIPFSPLLGPHHIDKNTSKIVHI